MNEDIHDSLEAIFDHFDRFCKERGCFYDIACDESDQQGYILKDRGLTKEMYEFIIPQAEELGVHVDVNENRKDGSLFTFTLETISDGHWKALSKKRKREEFSLFANLNDTKRVRRGDTLPNKGKGPRTNGLMPAESFARRLDLVLEKESHVPTVAIDLDGTILKKVKDRLNEDQYRWPPGKHTRDQSDKPQSINPSRSFGGISTNRNRKSQKKKVEEASIIKNIHLGSSIPVMIEPSSNVGVVPADRTNHRDSPTQKVKSCKKRKDLTDIPQTAPEEGQVDDLITALDERFNELLGERTLPSARAGRLRDNLKRLLMTHKIVPSGIARAGQIERPDDDEEQLDDIEMDDVAAKERKNPYDKIGREINLRPLGLFGPGDQRQPATRPASNVRTQHPPDRSFDASFPSITVPGQKWGTKNPEEGDTPGMDPLRKDKYQDDSLLRALEKRFSKIMGESYGRPEDGYDFMQRLVAELDMTAQVRKFRGPHNVWVKACNGNIKLELEHHTDGYADGLDTFRVYKQDQLKKELDVDLSKNTVVIDTVKELRGIVS